MKVVEQRQESEDERLTKLDNRIERARARHELARRVMGTIFLVHKKYIHVYIMWILTPYSSN